MAQGKVTTAGILAIIAVGVLGGAGVWIGFGQPSTVTPNPPKGAAPAKKEEAPKKLDVTISGTKFELDLALDQETRFKGLSGKTEIPEKGGLLFAFPQPQPKLEFVMRDCPIGIDIIYCDANGRIVAWHKMVPEPPRGDDEKANTAPFPGAPAWSWTNDKYESRLKKYSSKFSAQFAIELRGGATDALKLKAGDKVEMDLAVLKKWAK